VISKCRNELVGVSEKEVAGLADPPLQGGLKRLLPEGFTKAGEFARGFGGIKKSQLDRGHQSRRG